MRRKRNSQRPLVGEGWQTAHQVSRSEACPRGATRFRFGVRGNQLGTDRVERGAERGDLEDSQPDWQSGHMSFDPQ